MRRPRLSQSASRVLLPVLILALGLSLAACGGGEDEASIEERLDEKGTMEVMEEAGKAEYDPPADGRLSEEQVEQYIEVQQRATRIRQVAKKKMEETAADGGESGEEASVWSQVRNMGDAMQGFGDVMTAEIRAAQELGHNPAEYQWVKQQIMEAMAADAMGRMQAGIGESQRQLLASLEERREEAEDPQVQEMLDAQIEAMRETLVDPAESGLDPGVEANIELVQRYQEEITAAAQEPEAES